MLCASVEVQAEAEGDSSSSQNEGSQINGRAIRSKTPQCCNIWVGRVLYLSTQLTRQPSRVEDSELLLIARNIRLPAPY